QALEALAVGRAKRGIVHRDENERLRAASLRVARELDSLGLALAAPFVEALQGIDGEDGDALRLRRLLHLLRRRSVGQGHAGKIIADLDLGEAKRACQREEALSGKARRRDMVEREF